ncbi:MAG TPA: hypothetical protein VKP69_34460, partial [Isosphaeraceae bacterium]|nr:hypothetical protein [Isosphaeraceae bacterium]
EVATTYEGMMIAWPPSEWAPLGRLSLTESAEFLQEVASQAWLAKYPPDGARPEEASAEAHQRSGQPPRFHRQALA